MVSKKIDKNIAIFCFLRCLDVEFVNVLSILLLINNISQADIANTCWVNRSFINQVIKGKRDSEIVKQAITEALGFNPWAF